jgi:hypothetical protein
MADNNLARNRNSGPDFFADDDPLAELARIVGYDERLVPTAQTPVPPAVSAARREPAFNLEDELLLEFEQYDSPRVDPVHDDVVDQAAARQHEIAVAEPVKPEELEFAAPAVEPTAVLTETVAEVGYDQREYGHVGSEVEFDAPEPEAARAEPLFDFDEGEDFAQGEATVAAAPSIEPVEAYSMPEPTTAPAEDLQPYAFDLAAELESSIGVAATPDVQPAAKPEFKRKDAYVPGFRMPLANFNPTSGFGPGSRPVQQLEDAGVQPSLTPAPGNVPAWDFSPQTSAAVDDVSSEPWSVSAPEVTTPNIEPASGYSFEMPAAAKAPVESKDKFSALDELIYDVARFPVTQGGAKQPTLVTAPQAIEMVAPVAVPKPVPAEVPAPVSIAAPDLDSDPFADEEFELALDDLELDLADVVVEENSKRAVVPDAAAPRFEPQPVQAAVVEPIAALSAKPVYKFEEDVTSAESDADLPFDPALFADSDERPEVIADLDVPLLPVDEPEREPAYRADYDFDIDAELATLLVSPAATPRAAAKEPEVAVNAAERSAQDSRSIYSDLDEFERALEEDFRRSLATPLPASERYADVAYAMDAAEGQSRAPSRMWILPLAFAGVLAVAGGGAYAWLGGGVSSLVASGEPIVIAADKEPVKVAPENPGGKTVPNQDKAVYDRVAGAAPETPKQHTLISSNEEPVDVVQKTLMPDNIPLEGENDIEPTDVGETEDPRLLPQQTSQQASVAQQDPVTVTPRKVKTMIVRPDGKLVEQEVSSPAPALAAIQSEKIPAAASKPVEVAAMPQRASVAPATSPVQPVSTAAGIVPVSAPIKPSSEPVNVVRANSVAPTVDPAPAAVTPPAAPAQPVAAAPAAKPPVPAMRPSQQPVNVVASVTDQGNVRASTQAQTPVRQPAAQAQAAPTQVASLGDGGYVIQIASLPSQPEAQKSYQSLSAKFGGVIGGRGVDIKQAEIAGKGTFYRVRIPAGSKTEAISLCERYRSAGGTCLVAK